MALNLFMLDQASRRAWRLGKREEVRIYYMAYANTAGHTKLRKLGQQSGAAAAFAGEPARGALIAHAGADKTTLARLSSLLKQREGECSDEEEDIPVVLVGESEVAAEEAALKVVFAQRAEELRQALARGRQWLGGITDDLGERLAALAARPDAAVSVWRERPLVALHPRAGNAIQVAAKQPRDDTKRAVVESLPVLPLPSPLLPADALFPVVPEEAASAPLPAVSIQEPAPVPVVGSRAEVIFGRDEHIALARVRSRPSRSGASREPVKRRTPVSEREIPSLTEGETEAGEGQSQQVAMPSLWDLLVAPTSGVQVATSALLAAPAHSGHAPRQSRLWE